MNKTELMIDALQDALDTLENLLIKGADLDHDDIATINRIKFALKAAGAGEF